MSYSRSTIRSTTSKYSEGISDDSFSRSSISSNIRSSSRYDTGDALSSIRRTSRPLYGEDDDDDAFSRRSRALDDFGSTRRSLRSRIEDDVDSGIDPVRRTSRLSSRDEDDTTSVRRSSYLSSRLSKDEDDVTSVRRSYLTSRGSKDEDDSSSVRRPYLSSRNSKDEDDSSSVRRSNLSRHTSKDDDDAASIRSTKLSSLDDDYDVRSYRKTTRSTTLAEDDDSFRYKKSDVTSSYLADDSSSTVSVKASHSSISYEKDDGLSDDRVTKKIMSKSESVTSETESKIGQIYEAIVDFSPMSSDAESIALKEGQEVEVLDTSKVRRWLVRTRSFRGMPGGAEGLVPSCYLDKKTTADTQAITYETVEEPKDQEAAKRRETVVKELIDTEKDFSRDMQYVVKNYIKEMDNKELAKDLREQKDAVFGNFKDISEFHNNELIKAVQYYANEPSKLGVTFLRMERDFDKHVNYCKNEPRAQQVLAETDLKEHFDDFSKKIGDDKTLSEHLKLPIQRINDYQLLLKELIKYSVLLEEDTSDLKRALEFMQAIPQRSSDTEFINSIQGFKGNLHKLGKILLHDWFEVTEGKEGVTQERYVFLFKGRMCVTEVKRVTPEKDVYMMKHIAKLQDVIVRETDDERTLVIEHPDKKETGFPLKLRAKTLEQKESWVKELNVTAIPYEMEDLGEDEPTLVAEQPTGHEPQIEEPETIPKSKLVEQESYQTQSENKVESMEDFEAYEELNTVVTESIRSGSVTSLDASEVEATGPSKPRFTKSLRGVNSNQCDTATFECQVGGQPEGTVSWLKNNLQISTSDRVEATSRGNTHTLVISDVNQDDAGLYTAVATNTHGR